MPCAPHRGPAGRRTASHSAGGPPAGRREVPLPGRRCRHRDRGPASRGGAEPDALAVDEQVAHGAQGLAGRRPGPRPDAGGPHRSSPPRAAAGLAPAAVAAGPPPPSPASYADPVGEARHGRGERRAGRLGPRRGLRRPGDDAERHDPAPGVGRLLRCRRSARALLEQPRPSVIGSAIARVAASSRRVIGRTSEVRPGMSRSEIRTRAAVRSSSSSGVSRPCTTAER